VSGDFTVDCVVSDAVADPGNAHAPLVRGKTPDPCVQGVSDVHLGDHINLLVEFPKEESFSDSDSPKPADLVLFLDGRALPGTNGKLIRSETDDEEVTWSVLRFQLVRDLSTPEARGSWKEVVKGRKFGKEMSVSTGMEKGQAVPADARIRLIILRPWAVVVAVISAVIFAVIFWAIALKTGALRDKEPAGPSISDATNRAYSLSRVQAFSWTLVVIYAFLFVFWLTGEYNATLPGSIVILMGISLGTATAAAAVDSANSSNKQEKAQELQTKVDGDFGALLAQRTDLTRQLTKLKSALVTEPANADLKEQRDKVEGQIKELNVRIKADPNYPLYSQARILRKSALVAPKSGFFRDLFSNEGGAGLHRVQFGIWTLVLMIVFIYTVIQDVSLPDFDNTLLVLMGISSGAYAGMKIPENKGSTSASNEPADSNDDTDPDSNGS